MVKLIHVSDTHLRPFNPEPGDILIHSGDALNYGNFSELTKFRKQLADIHQNYKYIVFTPGNHDWEFAEDMNQCKDYLKETVPNIVVLHNEAVELEGLKFYGTADQPEFCNWAFNIPSEELTESYANIPEDTEVLITHCPPKGILDYIINRFHPEGVHVGSLELKLALPRLKKLKLNCYGHIHFSHGLTNIDGVCYSNGSIVDESYQVRNKENVIEL